MRNKKTVSIFVILLLIIAVHFLVVRMFLTGGREGEKTETLPPATEPPPVKTAPAVPVVPPEERLRKESANPNFGKHFTYRYAVKGDIPSLSGSAEATSGILVNLDNRVVLWAKNPRDGFPIASMTKMMTMLLVCEAVDNNPDLTLDTIIPVSRTAHKMGGSQVFLDPSESFPMRELLKTIAIKSANDSAQLVAEFVCNGDSYMFVEFMNKKASEMRLPNTKFFNPHGLPGSSAAEDNESSPEAMALLAEELLQYPDVVGWASTWSETFRDEKNPHKQIMTNHNRLVRDCPGVDGMKTGFIRRSGFCSTVTCKRGSTRLVAVVTGFKNRKARDLFLRKLLDWGYKQNSKIASEMKK